MRAKRCMRSADFSLRTVFFLIFIITLPTLFVNKYRLCHPRIMKITKKRNQFIKKSIFLRCLCEVRKYVSDQILMGGSVQLWEDKYYIV